MRLPLRRLALLGAALTVCGTLGTAPPAAAASACSHAARAAVPGAAHQERACLPDLTTAALAGTRYTDTADQAGLAAAGTRNPSGVPGLQLDGYFPDSSHTNARHGWQHDAQFVIRLPEHWNGGLVITGAPGNRGQYSTDGLISDYVLAAGYAYAATDKGNTGPDFYRDGRRPADAVAEWNRRTTQLARAARTTVHRYYGRPAHRTVMTGISNGGYLTRWQLENHPELYDGGVDWEGTLWTAHGPNLLTPLPTAVAWTLGRATAADMYRAGFAPGSEFLWPYHSSTYWGLTQKAYRASVDPGYDPDCPGNSAGSTPGEILAPCRSDARYDYRDRPAAVHRAVSRIALTGRLTRPLITLHGTLDTLLPQRTDSDVYRRMIEDAGRSALHRYYAVADGTHVDGLHDTFPDRLRPILPCYRSAFDALTTWTTPGPPPPAGHTIPRAPHTDETNTCPLR
ncbi:tannase/feruloyl esterase family alpha/beta hydrolase [Streptomyces sp. NPDC058045]|uniref:tannase/feruloyl esterase family alpha/beta hydrolase n=1 Tax=Streptomyces sp. NPDC058045 TaxID=3346311 RepID=UPI0036E25D8C